MARLANLTFRISCQGDGRRDSWVRAPFSTPALSNAQSPPASLNASSIGEFGFVQLQPGNVTITLPNSYQQTYPLYYAILVPPSNSTNGKMLKGNAGDVGISLAPNYPLVLAIGQNVTTFIIQSQGAEALDAWFV